MNKLEKLGIGTVQFGVDYGVSNSEGRTSIEEAREIIKFAGLNNINLLDTASTYGKSEEVLGICMSEQNPVNVVTKTPLFKDVKRSEARELLIDSFRTSLDRLKLEKVYGLMVHHVEDLLGDCSDEIISAMEFLKAKGLVQKIGFSFYSQEEAYKVLKFFTPDIVQLPLNLFDQELINSGCLKILKSNGVEIHARSAFLQGLVFIKPNELDPYFDFAKSHLMNFHRLINERNITALQASLSFVMDIPEVDKVIVGVCNKSQLHDLLAQLAKTPKFDLDWAALNYKDKKLTNPSLWRLSNG